MRRLRVTGEAPLRGALVVLRARTSHAIGDLATVANSYEGGASQPIGRRVTRGTRIAARRLVVLRFLTLEASKRLANWILI